MYFTKTQPSYKASAICSPSKCSLFNLSGVGKALRNASFMAVAWLGCVTNTRYSLSLPPSATHPATHTTPLCLSFVAGTASITEAKCALSVCSICGPPAVTMSGWLLTGCCQHKQLLSFFSDATLTSTTEKVLAPHTNHTCLPFVAGTASITVVQCALSVFLLWSASSCHIVLLVVNISSYCLSSQMRHSHASTT